jgi:hypothetical protein
VDSPTGPESTSTTWGTSRRTRTTTPRVSEEAGTQPTQTYTHTHTRTQAHTHTRTHAHTHPRTHTHTHTRTHAHTHTHMQASRLEKKRFRRQLVLHKNAGGILRFWVRWRICWGIAGIRPLTNRTHNNICRS